jgi:hypothetical protein
MARRPGGDGYSPARAGGDRAPTEMAPLFPGCDYEHWLIVMDKPGGDGASKQQMIECYVHTLAKVLGRYPPLPLSSPIAPMIREHASLCAYMYAGVDLIFFCLRMSPSEEEAKKKIYNVSCERYFGFGCEIDEETSNKLEGLSQS